MRCSASMFILLASAFLSSCATIVGGSKYNAVVIVRNHSDAKITYNGVYRGSGTALLMINRNHANAVSFTVKSEGCDERKYDFNSHVFRGWALLGTLVTWTGAAAGIPLPWGLATDTATGAFWKPNVMEKGVSKENYKNYTYVLDYEGCAASNE